jgi:hypothetical protein
LTPKESTYNLSPEWHKSTLDFFCRSFVFADHRIQKQFILDVIQVHDNNVVIEATIKPDEVVEVTLKNRKSLLPCPGASCTQIIQQIENCYNILNEYNN